MKVFAVLFLVWLALTESTLSAARPTGNIWKQQSEMEFIKIMFAVTCLVSSAPTVSARYKTPSDLEIQVKGLLAPRVNIATAEMKKLYPFITLTHLLDPIITLGLDDTRTCSSSQPLKEKLSVLMKLSNFISPLYVAYSYEQTQGNRHTSLYTVLKETSTVVNDTVSVVRHKMQENAFALPSHVVPTEAEMDEFTRQYLQAFHDKNLITLTVTDDLVKAYRNYVIMYTLHEVIQFDIIPCLKGV